MCEFRLAQKSETAQQKEIWKLCFGDPDSYINFYYAKRYKEDETALMFQHEEIAAMLTMIPVRTVFPNQRSYSTAMLYAIATHPKYQRRGFAAQLMEFSNQYLRGRENEFSVLVPANKELFDYYTKQGYQEGFYIREALLTLDRVNSLPSNESQDCRISPISPQEYNYRRNKQLGGQLFIAYGDEDIAYQKKLSQQTGADIYAVDIENIQGCLTVERISAEKVFIKESIIPDDYLDVTLQQIARQLPAKEYIVRTPSFLGKPLGGLVRPFAMIRVLNKPGSEILSDELGYLGIAFD